MRHHLHQCGTTRRVAAVFRVVLALAACIEIPDVDGIIVRGIGKAAQIAIGDSRPL